MKFVVSEPRRILNIFRCFSAVDARWTLKIGLREVNLSVWPSPEFERDRYQRNVILSARCEIS